MLTILETVSEGTLVLNVVSDRGLESAHGADTNTNPRQAQMGT